MKLRQFFTEDRKDGLRVKLLGQEPLQALAVISNELATIGQDSRYRRSLTSREALVAVGIIEQIRRSFADTLSILRTVKGDKLEPTLPSYDITLLQRAGIDAGHIGAVAGAIIGSILAGRVGTILGSLGGTFLGKVFDRTSRVADSAQQPVGPTERVILGEPEVLTLTDYLDQAFGEVDKIVESTQTPPSPEPELDGVALDFLQDLLSNLLVADDRQLLKLVRSKWDQVTTLLVQYGINVVQYKDLGEERLRSEFFASERTMDPNQVGCVTLLPALERGGKVLRRGKVLIPQQPVPSG